MKKLALLFVVFVSSILLVGCGGNKRVVEGDLDDVMSKLYKGLKDDEKPMMLQNIEVDKENIEGFIGTSDIEYESIIASESATGSIAHSVVLIRTTKDADIEAIKKEIKKNINPRKWVCVGVEKEDVIIKNKGDLIIVIVVENQKTRETIEKNFDNL